MDVWRLTPGGAPERITFHNARVSHPTFRDPRTLLYLATADDGSGPWLYAMDVRRRVPRRVSFGVETYTSLAASGDGSRLAVTVARAKDTLWQVPLGGSGPDAAPARTGSPCPPSAAVPPIRHRHDPVRVGQGGSEGIWKLAGGSATELAERAGRPPARRPRRFRQDGRRIAFSVEERGHRAC